MANKQKKWRRDAEVLNFVESIKEGKRVKHQGRVNKVRYVQVAGTSSNLVGDMLAKAAEHGNFTFCFTKAQIKELKERQLNATLPVTIEGETNEVK